MSVQSEKTSTPSSPSDVKKTSSDATLGVAGHTIQRASDTTVTLVRDREDQLEWDRLVKQLRTAFSLTTTGSLAGDLPARLSQITSSVVAPASAMAASLPHFHVEALLDQCADLLDRGLSTRERYDELASKWFAQLLELHEFASLDIIHRQEEAAGVYETPAEVSRSDVSSSETARSYSSAALNLADYLVDNQLDYQSRLLLNYAAQKQAWLTGVVPYSFGEGDFNGYVTHTFSGVTKDVSGHAMDAAQAQNWAALDREETYAQIQRTTLKGRVEEADAKLEGLRAKARWDSANARFMRQRTRVARDLQDIKLKASTIEEGLLNYSKRLDGLRNRFLSDFTNAAARMLAASRGLSEIYGYAVPAPNAGSGATYFDDCLVWVRESIDWIVRQSRRDQSFMYPVSIRKVVGETEWRSGRRTGSWTFELGPQAIPEFSLVRVRGVALTAKVCALSSAERIWQVRITPPRTGEARHRSGAKVNLDQSTISPCIATRVATRTGERDLDVHAITAWHNTSPFGIWQVELLSSIPDPPFRFILKDIVIDIALTACHRTGDLT